MSFANKDQRRSMKTVVQARLGSAFKSRRQMNFAEGKLIVPTSPESECSTLVDFGDDYTIADEEVADTEESDTLSLDNSAWRRGDNMHASRAHRVRQPKAAKVQVNRAQMLDADDMSWNIPKSPKPSVPTRILHALAGQ